MLAPLRGAVAGVPRFRLERLRVQPVLDLAPHHVGACSCYRDRAGTYHLFTDFIRDPADTTAARGTEIRYYRGRDLEHWEFIDTAVPRGRWRGSRGASDLDWFGAASPDLFVNYGRAFLFYAGREHGRGPKRPVAPPSLRCRIMLAEAPVDADAAPATLFRKSGVALDKGPAGTWDDLRLDQPCAIRHEDTLHLYYKGLPVEGGPDALGIGHARAIIGRREFFRPPTPDLAVDGGCAMPRVFLHGGLWHMFVRRLGAGNGSRWHAYVSGDGDHWTLRDDGLFNAGSAIALVRSVDGELAQPITALVTAPARGVPKLWAFRVRVV